MLETNHETANQYFHIAEIMLSNVILNDTIF